MAEVVWVLTEGHAVHMLEHGVDGASIVIVVEMEHWAFGDGELRAQTALEEGRP